MDHVILKFKMYEKNYFTTIFYKQNGILQIPKYMLLLLLLLFLKCFIQSDVSKIDQLTLILRYILPNGTPIYF